MAILRKGKGIDYQLHEGKIIKQIYHLGKMYVPRWFKNATITAIEVVFGVEEYMLVISKTNGYLNAIAATDPARAQQIANFINEDPLLVCSLVETSKTRWLVFDGNEYIDTGFYPNQDSSFMVRVSNSSKDAYWFGAWNKAYASGAFSVCNDSTSVYSGYDGQGGGSGLTQGKSDFVIGLDKNIVKIKEEVFRTFDYTNFALNYSILIGAQNRVGKPFLSGSFYLASAKAKDNGADTREMYPFIRNGENGMLDILSGTFYPNANTQGSFTIQLTDKV